MSSMNRLILVVFIITLAACSNGGSEGGATGGGEESADSKNASPPDESVFDPMVGTLDRAEAVEDLALERKDELDQRMKDLE